jgi:hypothetical protein
MHTLPSPPHNPLTLLSFSHTRDHEQAVVSGQIGSPFQVNVGTRLTPEILFLIKQWIAQPAT